MVSDIPFKSNVLPNHIPSFIPDNHFLIFSLSVGYILLADHKDCSDQPVEANSRRELEGKESCHGGEDIDHHLLHLLHIGHVWVFWFFFFFFLFCFVFLLGEPHLTELETTSEEAEDDTNDTTALLQM